MTRENGLRLRAALGFCNAEERGRFLSAAGLIGLSIVRLLGHEGNLLQVRGVDVLDDTRSSISSPTSQNSTRFQVRQRAG